MSTPSAFSRSMLRLLAFVSLWMGTFAFVHPTPSRLAGVHLYDSKFNRELEEKAMRRAMEEKAKKGEGMGETAAGAVLGGLVLGPFGALFGASMGANFGSARALDRARKEEMQRMGITPDMLKMAEEVGQELERAVEGQKASRDSLETQQLFARRLENDSDRIYEKAKEAMSSGYEESARSLLTERQQIQQKLKKVLLGAAEEKQRLDVMERNVRTLENRAMEIESLLRRSVGAKSLQDTSMSSLSLSNEDPLLQKFRDMGID